MPGVLPEILEQPQIPPPLHGVNPRSIMGRQSWDVLRREVYAKHGYCCAACGVKSKDAIIKRGLEAHERFTVNYRKKRMVLIGMEPLCHACHSFVHTGLLQVRLVKRQISLENVLAILGNGIQTLEASGGRLPPGADFLCKKLHQKHGLPVHRYPPRLSWRGWAMEWNGQTYHSPYPTEAAWRAAMK
jgi:hypothetical protein